MTGRLTRRAALAAVPAAAVTVPFRDAGAADDPLLDIERALREAEDVAQQIYELMEMAEDRDAARAAYADALEGALRERLATAPAQTLAGAAAKLRLAVNEMDVAGIGGPALAAVRTTLGYIEAEAARC